MPRVNMALPQWQDGGRMVADPSGLGEGIAGMLQNRQETKQKAAQEQKFNRANDVYSQTSSFLQIDPNNRSAALIESAQYDRQNGNEEDYLEKIRMSNMAPDVLQQELIQDYTNASNILNKNATSGLAGMGIGGGAKSNLPSDVQETMWFNQQPPEIQEQHMKLKRRAATDYAAMAEYQKILANIKAEQKGKEAIEKAEAEASVSDITASTAEAQATATATGTKVANRNQAYIDTGLEAADSLYNIKKGLNLLNSVKTGGIDNALLRGKQWLGVESADEADLSATVGKNVLAQLKPIFGSQFTEKEGAKLEVIEANYGKSTAGNKRLLTEAFKLAERAARRGLDKAKASGDDFTAKEIQSGLDMLKEIEADGSDKIQTVTTQEQFNLLPSGAIYLEEGVQYRKP